MPVPQRIQKFALILIPQPEHIESPPALRKAIRAAKMASRIAYQLDFTPIAPLLYYLTFMSPAEYSMDARRLNERWLRRTDRIWLQFPDEEEKLDSVVYQILDDNERDRKRHRPVYRLHPVSDDFIPVVMAREDIQELLTLNFTAGVAKYCF